MASIDRRPDGRYRTRWAPSTRADPDDALLRPQAGRAAVPRRSRHPSSATDPSIWCSRRAFAGNVSACDSALTLIASG